MIRLSIYDDSNDRRESLAAFSRLSPNYELVGSYENCVNIIEEVESAKPDLILMDIEMPEVDGISGVKQVKEKFPSVKILMQTIFDDDDKVFAALQAGAEGYLLKSASLSQLTQAIDEIMNGGAMMSPSIALKVMRYFNQSTATPDYNLTPKETIVLQHLANGLSYKMIADKMGISYFTVNNHVRKIYDKLQVNSMGEAIAVAHKQKLV